MTDPTNEVRAAAERVIRRSLAGRLTDLRSGVHEFLALDIVSALYVHDLLPTRTEFPPGPHKATHDAMREEIGTLSSTIHLPPENNPAHDLAKRFHATYERLAPEFGYRTRTQSAVPWDDVPLSNRLLMIATVNEVLGPFNDDDDGKCLVCHGAGCAACDARFLPSAPPQWKLTSALHVHCPTCRSRPSYTCVSPTDGAPIVNVHTSRYRMLDHITGHIITPLPNGTWRVSHPEACMQGTIVPDPTCEVTAILQREGVRS